MTIRTFAFATLAVAALTLGGCSSETDPVGGPRATDLPLVEPTDGDRPAEPTATATPAAEVVQTKIPFETRDAHFPDTAPEHLNWLPGDSAAPGPVSRRVLPCDDAGVSLGIDRWVLAHAETVLEQDGYLISRQLTLYPDTATADTFVSQLSESPRSCSKLMGSAALGVIERFGGYTPDRAFGTADPSVVFSETDMSYGPNRFVFVDIVNQRDNAILFTRVALLNQPIRGGAVSRAKERNGEFVRQVRLQGDSATAILGELAAR